MTSFRSWVCSIVVVASTLVACGGAGASTSPALQARASAPTPVPDLCTHAPTPTPAPGGDSFCARPSSTTVMPGGLQIGDFTTGHGGLVETGATVLVQCTGWLQSTGAMFDTSRQPGRQPFAVRLGSHTVIAGWDQGLPGMRVGGKRRLVIPPALAYGAQGRPPLIPGNATLVFDIEVLSLS